MKLNVFRARYRQNNYPCSGIRLASNNKFHLGDMTLEDPFFVVKDDVVKAVHRTQGLYHRWCELHEDLSVVPKEELDWVTNELRNSLRSIEWDLEDLEETITIVEKNPKKFKIEDGEINNRRGFIEQTREHIQSMKDKMNLSKSKEKDRQSRQPLLSTSGLGLQGGGGGYTRLHNDVESPNHSFIDNHVQQQQVIVRAQDEQLDLIHDSVGTLKSMSSQIGQELDEQAIMLDEFSHEMEATESDRRQWIAIIVLSSVMVVVIILLCVHSI